MDDAARQRDVNAAEMIRAIESNPAEAVRSVLGDVQWKKVCDYETPLADSSSRPAFAALNTIGILEGASGLQRWRAGRSAWGSGSKDTG
jgi:hypothetical protein